MHFCAEEAVILMSAMSSVGYLLVKVRLFFYRRLGALGFRRDAKKDQEAH